MDTGVLFEDMAVLRAVGELKGVDRIYSPGFPFEDLRSGDSGIRWIQVLPYIFRGNDRVKIDGRADGVLVRNLDELGFVLSLGYEGEIVADSTLYTMNSASAGMLLDDGVARVTYPLEADLYEMKERGFAESSELVIYGRAPLMISANCAYRTVTEGRGELCKLSSGRVTGRQDNGFELCKSNSGRTKEKRDSSPVLCKLSQNVLTDRRGADFPVLRECRYCYNVIYNSVPTSLHRCFEKVRGLEAAGVRIDITVEDGDTAEMIIEYYVNFIKGRETREPEVLKAFTYGHFRNPVE